MIFYISLFRFLSNYSILLSQFPFPFPNLATHTQKKNLSTTGTSTVRFETALTLQFAIAAQVESGIVRVPSTTGWPQSCLAYSVATAAQVESGIVGVPTTTSLRIQPPLIRSRYYVRNAKRDVCDSRPKIPY